MKIIGVTGPSGAGKSVFCAFLHDAGCEILDCDEIYHGLINAPSDCVEELTEPDNFGKEILGENGGVDRQKLGAIVFKEENKNLLNKLNEISHRHVTIYVNNKLEQLKTASQPPKAAIIDAPLLFQANMQGICDATIALLAGRAMRLCRLTERDRVSTERLEARLNAAPSDEYYSEKATYTVINDGSIEKLKENALTLLKTITED